MENKTFTPEKITELQENEVFVFGSNEAGIHGAGAALLAKQRFGAKQGVGYGLQGQSFAIPTKDEQIQTLELKKIKEYIEQFIAFAQENNHLKFLVTKIGCGLAGIEDESMKKIFTLLTIPENVILPKEFCVIRGYKAYGKGLICRGKEYKEGEIFEEEQANICQSGDYSKSESTGLNNVIANIGINGKVKGIIGNWITLAEYDENNKPICVKSAIIDGKILKENVWYSLVDCKFKEVE